MALDLKAQMTEDLKRVQEKLATAREKYIAAKAKMEELGKQEHALQTALEIMTGEPRDTFYVPVPEPYASRSLATREVGRELRERGQAKIEVVDGVEYEVPDGFVLGKNSFGEISILPAGTTAIPMAEPTKPAPTTHGVILPATNETLDRPEDML